ncbi:MAG: 30S ribosomal protein S9 [Puniceicoccales bacterium]|jgi:small subunit ribosomal protein S9|nr:30S ribosomal protein S9 [Puniceicoccales bacterium]
MSETQETGTFIAVGRRKTSSARVRLTRGTGQFTVNKRPLETYCYTETLAKTALRPLDTLGVTADFDVVVLVNGGGPNSQAGAISHGLARALEKFNPENRALLKKSGLLTRDGRMKERKKSGRPGARKRFQFSKR